MSTVRTTATIGDTPVIRWHVRVRGLVQGVGFRPFAHALATSLGLAGHVGNDTEGVFCEVEGHPDAVSAFAARVGTDVPRLALVERVETRELAPTGRPGFRIVGSRAGRGDRIRPARTQIAPDTVTCPDCLRELADPGDRRYRYPFIACTNCGPRLSMLTGLPYDRPGTTMADFPLCPDCAREYADPADRRFHAQPTACPACGPRLELVGPGRAPALGEAALAGAINALRDGAIVAVKGLGGYHLACDATRPEVVASLRARKHRSAKPFAVLVPDLATAARLGVVGPEEEAALTSPAGPIVLLETRRDDELATRVAAAVAPGAGRIGVLLPPTALHHLLLAAHPDLPARGPDVLVLTSANLSDEPIITDDAEAVARLAAPGAAGAGPIADLVLRHDRRIALACDDSVTRVVEIAGERTIQPVRRSRGYAPLPVRLSMPTVATLAVGGELKTTFCLADGQHAWLSQHIGDMAALETLAVLERGADVLGALLNVRPRRLVADRHPGYLTRRWARDRAAAEGLELVEVQHHHAHLASLLAEHEWPVDGPPVLGFAFDGTGYGDDGAIWGGELLLGGYARVERVGHLAEVALPGGDAAIRRPPRVALAHLRAAGLPTDPALPAVAACDPVELRVVGQMLARGAGCVPTTSVGRLFDAVSSLSGVCHDSGYEGQAAIELEARAAAAATTGPDDASPAYRFEIREERSGALVLGPAPVLAAVVADVRAGTDAGLIAARFHAALADAVLATATRVRTATGVTVAGLTGGVFGNALLTSLCARRLAGAGFDVLAHRRVPPNDGGLALGQVAVAASRDMTTTRLST